MTKSISSLQNSTVKSLLRLQEKSRTRKKEGRFIVEGIREIELALQAGYQIEILLYNPAILDLSNQQHFKSRVETCVEVTDEVYKKIAYRNSTEGVLAIAEAKDHNLKNLQLKNKHPLILVAEAPEKPGNIGALLRTADAARADAVIIANPRTDLYNPNIIRSSVGCVFTCQIAMGDTPEIIRYLKNHQVDIYCATLQAAVLYTTQDYKRATAIVVGTEADGLSTEWRNNATQNIIIPMGGKIDSMNVSVSAGILLFEARRQRGFN